VEHFDLKIKMIPPLIRRLQLPRRFEAPGGQALNNDDEGDKIVAIMGCGLLSPIFDRPVDIREPLKIDDGAFNRMVVDLRERGLLVVPDSTWIQ
jgi:hypothetical protein